MKTFRKRYKTFFFSAFLFFLLTIFTFGTVTAQTATPTSSFDALFRTAITSTPAPDFSNQPKGNGSDKAEMIYIPEGTFEMGAKSDNNYAHDSEKPQHTVKLSGFWIDKYEVTNAQYAECVKTGYCVVPRDLSSHTRTDYYSNTEYADYPVINVDWNQAYYYCTFAGKRLPTEAEWEKAARGDQENIYPWGNDKPGAIYGNYGMSIEGDTTPVSNYPSGISPYGVYNMFGNVWEWTNDKFSKTWYSESPTENPQGPTAADNYDRTIRGISWSYSLTYNEITLRGSLNMYKYANDIGFRCAYSDPN